MIYKITDIKYIYKFYLHKSDFVVLNEEIPLLTKVSIEAELTQLPYKRRAKRDNSGACPFAKSQKSTMFPPRVSNQTWK